MGARRCESGQCAEVRANSDGSVDVWSTRRPSEVTHLDADELPVSAEVLALLGGYQPATPSAGTSSGRQPMPDTEDESLPTSLRRRSSEERTEETARLTAELDRANAALQRVRDLTDPARHPGYVDRDEIWRIVQNVGDGGHVYLATACLHGQHDLCGVKQRERGDESPPHCKYCPAPCVCRCHVEETP